MIDTVDWQKWFKYYSTLVMLTMLSFISIIFLWGSLPQRIHVIGLIIICTSFIIASILMIFLSKRFRVVSSRKDMTNDDNKTDWYKWGEQLFVLSSFYVTIMLVSYLISISVPLFRDIAYSMIIAAALSIVVASVYMWKHRNASFFLKCNEVV